MTTRSLLSATATRRSLLRRAGIIGAATVAPSAWARQLSERVPGRPPSSVMSPPGGFLSLTLTFANGLRLSFNQANATDIGTYNGQYVQQRNLRQRASGNGDFRDAFTVFFRPDNNGQRFEVVVEYGTEFHFPSNYPLSGPRTISGQPPKTLKGSSTATKGSSASFLTVTPYTATISGNGLSSAVTITVPYHPWGARWRWQSAARPIVDASYREAYTRLLGLKAIPPMNTTPVWGVAPTEFAPGKAWDGPMSTGDLDLYIADYGDRMELGFITEQQACYLLTGESSAKETMLTDAEASGTTPLHVRDAVTSAPVNVQTYHHLSIWPSKNQNGATHSTQIPSVDLTDYISACFNFADDSAAHAPALNFVPWLLTDDPYYLEEAQFWANYHMIESNLWAIYYEPSFGASSTGLVQVSTTYQNIRAFAWGMRDIFRQMAFAPGGSASPYPSANTVPQWILSGGASSYWAKCVSDNLTFGMAYVSTSSSGKVTPVTPTMAAGSQADNCLIFYHMFDSVFMIPSFEYDYLGIVLGWAVWSRLFPSGWSRVLNYAATARLAMSDNSGGSGWDWRYPCPYCFPVYRASLGAGTPDGGGSGWTQTGNPDWGIPNSAQTPTGWGTLWKYNVAWANGNKRLVNGWTDPSGWTPNQLSAAQIALPGAGYCAWARAALAMLDIANVPMPTNFTTTATPKSEEQWLRGQLNALSARNYSKNCGYRWAIWALGD